MIYHEDSRVPIHNALRGNQRVYPASAQLKGFAEMKKGKRRPWDLSYLNENHYNIDIF